MEGRIVLMSVLLVSVVLGLFRQILPEISLMPVAWREAPGKCVQIIEGNKCPSDYPYRHDILENTDDDAVNEYCKLGCVSSVCAAITTLQNSDASKVVNGAVEKCTNACSAFCTKGSICAVETA